MSEHEDTSGKKGRPTPSRKEAELARRQERKPNRTRREQMEADRRRRREIRAQQREALNTGKGDLLPPRDRGPVKAFVRDYVDRRRNVAEYLLVLLVFMLLFNIFGPQVMSAIQVASVVSLLWMATILGTVLDEIVLVRGLKKQLRERFPDASHKGTTSYAVLRSSQVRRFRLPKPVIERGGDLKNRY